ncbi:MAG: hypothetical protein WC719_04640 [Patescibacteria group bacterium]|jgi:hypothetical protein
MKNLDVIFEGLKSTWFPTKEDKAWKQWVDFRNREENDLIGLLTADVKEGFKRRALFLLLVPSSDFNSIYWKNEVGKFYKGPEFLHSLSPSLLGYVAELVSEFCRTLSPMHCERPKNIVSGGGDIRIFMQVPDKFHDALSFYNNCILELLPLLSIEQGEKIFSLFRLMDISSYSGMEDESGYNPFSWLLSAKDIDEKWKKMADVEMRKIVQNELSGKVKSREEWENALSCYASVVQSQIFSGPNYSVAMFAEQMEFIVDNCKSRMQPINDWHVAKIFNILAADNYKDLRYKIAKFVVFERQGKHSEFSVYNEETLQAATQMITEFGDNDSELADKLTQLITINEEKQTDNAAKLLKKQQAEEKLLSQMK